MVYKYQKELYITPIESTLLWTLKYGPGPGNHTNIIYSTVPHKQFYNLVEYTSKKNEILSASNTLIDILR